MKLLKRMTVEYGGRDVKLYTAEYNGKEHTTPSVREALLFAFGFGTDQAAEFRYMVSKNKKGVKKNGSRIQL